MGSATSRLPVSAHFLSNKDCMKAFAFFDKDDTGLMEFPEMQEAFNTMLAPAQVDISCYEGQTFTAAKFRDVAEDTHKKFPQYNVAGNLMKFIRENADNDPDGDGVEITDKALQKVFNAYDKDGSGELSVMELFKLFEYLKIRLRLVFEFQEVSDGTITFDEFANIIRQVDAKHPGEDIDDKITGLAASLVEGVPDIDDQPDPDPDNDPTDADDDPDNEDDQDPPNKKALLVGINYIGSSCELGGCINDVRNEMQVLQEHYGFTEDQILLLTEDQDDDSKLPNAQNIRDGIAWLMDGAQEKDFLVFAYSGHGSQLPNKDGTEPDGKNEILCPLDLQDDWYANSISDDYLNDAFFDSLPVGVRCLCVYDCCHSGTMTDLSCTRDLTPPGEDCEVEEGFTGRFLEPPEEISSAITEAAEAAQSAGCLQRSMARDLEDASEKFQGKKLWTISGCQDNQTSADATIGGQRQGAMTWALLAALEEGGLKGPWSYKYDRLISTMRKKLKSRRFSQIPALCTTDEVLLNRFYLAKREGE